MIYSTNTLKGVYYTMELTKEYLYENYIVKNKSQAQIASESFIQNLRCVINKLCSSAYEIKTQSNQTHREYPLLQLRRGDTITFLDFIYTGHDRFRFKDKYNKYLDIVKSR